MLPLISGYRAEAPLFVAADRVWRQVDFLRATIALAAVLPTRRFVVNLCESRVNFAVGLAAAAMRQQISLLPTDRSAATVSQVQQRYDDSGILGDEQVIAALSGFAHSQGATGVWPTLGAEGQIAVPQIAADQTAVIVFTSGTTGVARPHAKTWGHLQIQARLLAARLEWAGAYIAATVPPQHTYGLETSIFAALAGTAVVHAGRPFFPHDVAMSLQALPAPRVLVTTPVHLRALVQAQIPLPPLAAIVSATAPLAVSLAEAAERQFATVVLEMLGATESGAVATRRTTAAPLWTPLPGVVLCAGSDAAVATAPYLDAPAVLADQVEVQSDGRFHLLGRSADMLKVAGKRASLAELTRVLLAIPGVEDGVVFLPPLRSQERAVVQRPAALVVAPQLDERTIVEALSRSVDAVFLPRPLRRVEALPHNELGKLPLRRLCELLYD